MSKKYDISYAQPAAKEGEKPRWITCGAVLETRNGLRIKLDTIPVGFNGWFALFEPKARGESNEARGTGRPEQQQRQPGADDDIGF